jgi:uncharacterized membrane protein
VNRRTVTTKIFIILLLGFVFIFGAVSATAEIKSQTTVLTAYLDGFVQVNQNIELSQSTLSMNIPLLGETRQNLIITDEEGLPLENDITGNTAEIFNIGSTKISVSYLTQDLTTKMGQYWTVSINYPESIVLVMPENASIISLSCVPDLIENSDGLLTLTMPPGNNGVTYTAQHASTEQTNVTDKASGLEVWQIIAIASVSLTIVLSLVGWRLLKSRKSKTKSQAQENFAEVDLDKLLGKNRELRQDEIQVVRFLANNHGKAFESELFELLNLPRTTTWRLIRRLEGMEIVYVKKSRRQNIVLIRDKYLKKQLK